MVPRMLQAERDAIAAPRAIGILIYQTDNLEGFYYWDGTEWLWIGTELIGNYVYGTGAPGQVGYWTASSTITGDNNLFWDVGNTRLGIGTNTPRETLDILGGLRVGNTTSTNAGAIRWTGSDFEGYDDNSAQWKSFTKNPLSGEGEAGQVTYWESSTFIAGDDNLFWDMTNHWLGIGTKTPREVLEVDGGIRVGNTTGTTEGAIRWNGVDDFEGYNGSQWLSLTTSTLTGSGAATQVTYWTSINNLDGDNGLYWDESNTFLGLGTTTPREAFDIAGAIKIGNSTPSSSTVTGAMRWTGSDFEGYDGSSWLSFTKVSGLGGTGTLGQIAYWQTLTTIAGEDENYFDMTNKRHGVQFNTPDYPLQVFSTVRLGGEGASGQLAMYSDQAVTDYEVFIKPSATMTQNTIYNFPGNYGNPNDALTTNGAGDLYWEEATAALGDFWKLDFSDQALVTYQDWALARYSATITGASSAIIKSQINFGVNSTSNALSAAILGGLNNTATGDYSFITGGESNLVSDAYAYVIGGSHNTVSGQYSRASGYGNTVSGDYSVIPGGRNLTLSGNRAYAFRGGLTTTPYTLSTDETFYLLDAHFHHNEGNADADFQIDGDTNDNLLFMDASADKIGIGINNPVDQLDVRGNVALTNSSGTASGFQFAEPSGSGTHYSQFAAQAQNDSNLVYKLPPWHNIEHSALFNNLYADGDGILEWADPETVKGYLRATVFTTDSNYTATEYNVYIIVRNSANVDITLPLASTVPGKRYYIKRMSVSSAAKITVLPSGTDKIDGANKYSSSKMKECIMMVSDGSNWYIYTKYFGLL
ncbi:hypothetical protein ACFLSQ_04045 [Bacteroidota bacterium]